MRTGYEFPSALLLDSGGGWLENRRGGFLSFGKPDFTLSSEGSGFVITRGKKTQKIKTDPVCAIEKKTSEGYTAVGFFGYEYLSGAYDGRKLADKPHGKIKGAAFEFPLLSFHFYGEKSNPALEKNPDQVRFRGGNGEINPEQYIRSGFSADLVSQKKQFIAMVGKVKSHIRRGDVYQVNISREKRIPLSENSLDFFMRFFDSQPVPFASYMDFGKFQFLSGSMELFLKKTGDRIVSRPIKGTIRRGKNPSEDRHMRKTLSSSEKEKAEILMITDLARNDLSRVCVPSSIKVRNVFNVKPYKTLFHMESEVEGVLQKNISISEIINKTFPPGSVTGAPKTKAVEIIDRIEPHSRGPYCGAAGIFYPGGDFCLSVSIRCLQTSSAGAVCWSGAGIVWDSDPEKEFEETVLKFRALENASGIKNRKIAKLEKQFGK